MAEHGETRTETVRRRTEVARRALLLSPGSWRRAQAAGWLDGIEGRDPSFDEAAARREGVVAEYYEGAYMEGVEALAASRPGAAPVEEQTSAYRQQVGVTEWMKSGEGLAPSADPLAGSYSTLVAEGMPPGEAVESGSPGATAAPASAFSARDAEAAGGGLAPTARVLLRNVEEFRLRNAPDDAPREVRGAMTCLAFTYHGRPISLESDPRDAGVWDYRVGWPADRGGSYGLDDGGCCTGLDRALDHAIGHVRRRELAEAQANVDRAKENLARVESRFGVERGGEGG